MNDCLTAMMNRRAIRRYTQRQLPDELLEQILLAAAYSPNAGNRQTTQMVVCQDRALNQKLGRINKEAFHGRLSTPGRYISLDEPSIADDPSIASAFYDAPTVITLFGPKGFLYAEADCWIMASSIALAAYALGVGSCLIGRAEDTFQSPLGRQTRQAWGVSPDYEAKVHVTLGWPTAAFPPKKPRRYPNPIVIR